MLIGQPDGPFSRKQALSNRCKAVGETCPNQNNSPEMPAGSSLFPAPGVRGVGGGEGGWGVGLVLHSLFILHFVFDRCGILTVDTPGPSSLPIRPETSAPRSTGSGGEALARASEAEESLLLRLLAAVLTSPEDQVTTRTGHSAAPILPRRGRSSTPPAPVDNAPTPRVGRRTPGRPSATFPRGGPDLAS